MNRVFRPVLGLLGVAAMSVASATGSIDTFSSWNGSSNAGPFGEPDTATFGQSITTDAAGGLLQSFTFYLGPLDLDFRGYVFEWNGSKIVGPALFTSDVTNIGESAAGYRPVTVATGGVELAASKSYVLFLSASGLQRDLFNTNSWGALRTNAYPGGEFVFHNSTNDFSTLSADAGWDCPDGCGFFGNGADLAFKAQIDPVAPAVPEPRAYALFLGGLGLVSFLVRRRRP